MEKFTAEALCFSRFGRGAARTEEDRNHLSMYCMLTCMCSHEIDAGYSKINPTAQGIFLPFKLVKVEDFYNLSFY